MRCRPGCGWQPFYSQKTQHASHWLRTPDFRSGGGPRGHEKGRLGSSLRCFTSQQHGLSAAVRLVLLSGEDFQCCSLFVPREQLFFLLQAGRCWLMKVTSMTRQLWR